MSPRRWRAKSCYAAHGLGSIEGAGPRRFQISAADAIETFVHEDQFQEAQHATERVIEFVSHASRQLAECPIFSA